VEENAAVGVAEDDIEEMLKGCCCMWVHAVEDLFMWRGCRFMLISSMWLRSSRMWMISSRMWMISIAESDCYNAEVATVLGSIPASSDIAESEARQMKQCYC
jgi:hypothetical protein